MEYDFSGWATKNNILCSDGRTIMKDAFAHNDKTWVPLVWSHQHNDPSKVLGKAFLENRPEGVYCYGVFNDTEQGRVAKQLVQHGDVDSLSIYANQLKEKMSHVVHGNIREVSLVLAGANVKAHIDNVIVHSDDGYVESDDEAVIYSGDIIGLCHSDDSSEKESEETLIHSDEIEKTKGDNEMDNTQNTAKDKEQDKAPDTEETVADVFNTLTEKQKTVVYALIGQALEDANNSEGDNAMKHNLFDAEYDVANNGVLTFDDQAEILSLAKQSNVGSLQHAIQIYAAENDTLAHGINDIESLFPDYELLTKGAPEKIERDLGWVSRVMKKVHKSPISRIRTRHADLRNANLRANGYKKGKYKEEMANISLLTRTTDPQTVYVKDKLERDDVIDITDFDVVEYQYGLMKDALSEDMALAIMVGDGREIGDEQKIREEHIRPIWKDDDIFTIHYDVDFEAAKEELQGSDTDKHFSDNYVYAEAIIAAALYSREGYKGSGSMDFYCTPHFLNQMLLARDFNGRRIYDSKSDLESAINVSSIETAEQFEGLIRTDANGQKHKLIGIFVNLDDYHVGSTKGGELTKFEDFDIDFNQYKYLLETRASGALVKPYSAIVLEEKVD